MKIKKEYTISFKSEIWRLVPAEPDKLVIEARDSEAREVFFSCILYESGKIVFKDFQFEEKFWLGIETVQNNIILFNRFLKPDMPQHKGIIAFDIEKKQVIWENTELSFLFIKDESIYCYIQKFEGRNYFILNLFTGEETQVNLDFEEINTLKQLSDTGRFDNYLFPERYVGKGIYSSPVEKILEQVKTDNVVIGNIEYIVYNDVILLNYFQPQQSGLINKFMAVDIESGNNIFEEILTVNAKAAVPDSFYVNRNLIFLLKEKTRLLVCSLNN